jgi:hypothetical protein
MNTKLTRLTLAAALLSATGAFADQPFGRDSVYSAAGASTTSRTGAVSAVAGNGRGSVYAADLPAPTPKERVQIAVTLKPGRA